MAESMLDNNGLCGMMTKQKAILVYLLSITYSSSVSSSKQDVNLELSLHGKELAG